MPLRVLRLLALCQIVHSLLASHLPFLPLPAGNLPQETDFRETDSKDYYGLAPGKSVMLRYAYPLTCTGFSKDASGRVMEVQVG